VVGVNFDSLPPEVKAKLAKDARVKTPWEAKLAVAAKVLMVLSESGLRSAEQAQVLEEVIKWIKRGRKK